MHVHFGFLTSLLWIAVAFVAIQMRHRRKIEGLGRNDWRERMHAMGDQLRDTFAPDASGRTPSAPFSSTSSDERRELEELRERVKVLERIATEDRKTHDLAKEIEALRDR